MKIVSKKPLPSTTNGWGFGGAIDKVKFTMENGDVWVSGEACYRHAPSEKYIQTLFAANHPEAERQEWNGGMHNDRDVLLRGAPEKHIQNYYKRKGQ